MKRNNENNHSIKNSDNIIICKTEYDKIRSIHYKDSNENNVANSNDLGA